MNHFIKKFECSCFISVCIKVCIEVFLFFISEALRRFRHLGFAAWFIEKLKTNAKKVVVLTC